MFCTKCGKEYEGSTCPNCGSEQATEVTLQEQQAPMPQQQKPKKKKSTIIAIVIVVIVVLAIIAGATGGSDSKETNTESSTVSSSGNNDTTKKKETTTKKKDETLTVGDSVNDHDVKITFVSIEETMGNNEFMKPDAGKVFLIATFEYENNSKSEITVSSMLHFNAYVDTYSIDEDVSAMSVTDEHLDGTIAPGKKLRGSLCYQVDQDWKKYEVDVDSQGLFSSDIKFSATKKNLK